jgi:hypothetical protein
MINYHLTRWNDTHSCTEFHSEGGATIHLDKASSYEFDEALTVLTGDLGDQDFWGVTDHTQAIAMVRRDCA